MIRMNFVGLLVIRCECRIVAGDVRKLKVTERKCKRVMDDLT